MRSFLEWADDPEAGFQIRENWDILNGWEGEGRLHILEDHAQRRILEHVFTPDENGDFPYITVVYSTIKKSGKTTIAGAVGAWYFEEGPANSEIYCLANDEEQAQSRVYDDIAYHVRKRGGRAQKSLIPADNGTFIRALASEYRSVAGGRQALTLWDELWGYTSERSRKLWAEMTPPPTVRSPLRVIVTYAGFEGESELLWQLYQDNFTDGEVIPELADIVDDYGEPVCKRNGRVFVYWDTVPRMPWQTADYYDEQMATLRPNDFLRLHRNQWVTTKEEFVPFSFWERAEKKLDGPIIYRLEDPMRGMPLSVGVDAAPKNDCTAAVATYYDYKRGKVGIAAHKIWTPPPEERFDLTVVEDCIKEWTAQGLQISSIVYDPTQLHQAMTNLSHWGYYVEEYTQNQSNMAKWTSTLYDLLKNGDLEAYENEEAREHVRFTAAEIKGKGYVLVKQVKQGRKKIDFTVALAMSCYDAIKRGGVDTSEEIVVESPFGDVSEMEYKDPILLEMERLLPPELM